MLIDNNLISVRSDIDQGDIDVPAIASKALPCDLNAMVEKDEANGAAFDKIFGL